MTAVNDEGGQINVANDGSSEDTIPRTMQKYKQKGEKWMLVVDDNCERGFLPADIGGMSRRLVAAFDSCPCTSRRSERKSSDQLGSASRAWGRG
jgi:hypothetical protein